MSNNNGRDKRHDLVKRLADLDNSKRQALANEYMVVNPDQHCLSVTNTVLIYFQNSANIPVTMVAGYKQWQKYGRQVKSGQHGFSIRFPLKAKSNGDDDTSTDDNELRFWWSTVFDVSQTEEKPKY
jgi:hypothetical protein